MNTSKTLSARFDSLLRRITKVLRYGNDETREGMEVGPYGTDSNPAPNIRALYCETGIRGKDVIIGYININQVADVGEHRIYATDDQGVLQGFIWLKNDGTYQIGGTARNLVSFSELQSGFKELLADHNKLVDAFNAHLHPISGASTGIPTPGLGIPAVESTASVDASKIDEITTL